MFHNSIVRPPVQGVSQLRAKQKVTEIWTKINRPCQAFQIFSKNFQKLWKSFQKLWKSFQKLWKSFHKLSQSFQKDSRISISRGNSAFFHPLMPESRIPVSKLYSTVRNAAVLYVNAALTSYDEGIPGLKPGFDLIRELVSPTCCRNLKKAGTTGHDQNTGIGDSKSPR